MKREERLTDNDGIVICTIFNMYWEVHSQGTQNKDCKSFSSRRGSDKSILKINEWGTDVEKYFLPNICASEWLFQF